MPLHTYINAITGETSTVEMTGDELAEYLASQVEDNELLAKEAVKEQQRQAILDRLGITKEEASLLLS
jgi:hypothetical protein